MECYFVFANGRDQECGSVRTKKTEPTIIQQNMATAKTLKIYFVMWLYKSVHNCNNSKKLSLITAQHFYIIQIINTIASTTITVLFPPRDKVAVIFQSYFSLCAN